MAGRQAWLWLAVALAVVPAVLVVVAGTFLTRSGGSIDVLSALIRAIGASLSVALLGGGIWLLGVGLRNAWRHSASRTWPTTAGQVTRAGMRSWNDADGPTTYRAIVEYAYEVDGRLYRGTTVAFGYRGSASRRSAEGVLTRYPPLAPVAVRYDPAAPQVATLAGGDRWGIAVELGASAAFLYAAFALFAKAI